MHAQLCLTLCDPVDCPVNKAPLSLEFPRQENTGMDIYNNEIFHIYKMDLQILIENWYHYIVTHRKYKK